MKVKVQMELELKDVFDGDEIKELINDGLIESWVPEEHGAIKRWSITKVDVLA